MSKLPNPITTSRRRVWLSLLAAACIAAPPASAHPGSGIVVDRAGNVYVVDMVSGAWKLDAHGKLTHLPGPGFHWMALDAGDRFRQARLPSGADGDIARIGASPTLLLASDVPVAVASDGNLYYPSRSAPLRIIRLLPSGRTSTHATLPSAGPRWLNGIASGPDGAFYYTEDRRIRRVDKSGKVATVIDEVACSEKEGGRAQDPLLRGLAVDADGTIYAAATGCRAVLKVTASGDITRLPQLAKPWAPTGVARSGSRLYVLEFERGDSEDRRGMLPRVRSISADGKTVIVARVARH